MKLESSKLSGTRFAALFAAVALTCFAPLTVSAKPKDTAKAAAQADLKAPAAPVAPVDINAASEADLEKLPGVGAVTAKKIVAARPIQNAEGLAKAGLSKKTVEKITPLVTFGTAPAVAANPPPAAAPVKAAADKASEKVAKVTNKPATASQPVAPPAIPGSVWVNPESKVFHRADSRWYGKTKNGKYMTEEEAVKAGYRESKEKHKKAA